MYDKALRNKRRILSYLKKLISLSIFFTCYRLQFADKYLVNTVLDSRDNPI